MSCPLCNIEDRLIFKEEIKLEVPRTEADSVAFCIKNFNSIYSYGNSVRKNTTSGYDLSINQNLRISYPDDTLAGVSHKFDALDFLQILSCNDCKSILLVKGFRTLEERVTRDTGPPNYDPITKEYPEIGRSVTIRRLSNEIISNLSTFTINGSLELVKEVPEFLMPGLLKPLIKQVIADDYDAVWKYFSETPRHLIPAYVRFDLEDYYHKNPHPSQIIPSTLKTFFMEKSHRSPNPGVFIGDGKVAYLLSPDHNKFKWFAFDLINKKRLWISDYLDDDVELQIQNSKPNLGFIDPYLITFQKSTTHKNFERSSICLIDVNTGEKTIIFRGVLLFKEILKWPSAAVSGKLTTHIRNNFNVTIIDDRIYYPNENKFICYDLNYRRNVKELSLGSNIATGEMRVEGKDITIGLFNGVAVYKDDVMDMFTTDKPILYSDLEGLVCHPDGSCKNLITGAEFIPENPDTLMRPPVRCNSDLFMCFKNMALWIDRETLQIKHKLEIKWADGWGKTGEPIIIDDVIAILDEKLIFLKDGQIIEEVVTEEESINLHSYQEAKLFSYESYERFKDKITLFFFNTKGNPTMSVSVTYATSLLIDQKKRIVVADDSHNISINTLGFENF